MDERQQRINRAAEQLADTLVQAHLVLAEHGARGRELNAGSTEQFFNRVINYLQTQVQDTRRMTRTLDDQYQRGQEASQALAGESLEAYMDFVNSMFTYFQATPRATQEGAG